ncbi:MAG: GDSL-type esterase/lipase family protein [Phormidesmis sp.]
MVKWFTKIPSWAALSLIVNGLLFGSLLAVWQEQTSLAARADSPSESLPVDELAAHVAVTDNTAALPRPGGGRKLNYQQWVDVLKQEAQAAVIRKPSHLTVLLGDSLSLWFPGELMPGQRMWINQSISGERTKGLLNRLDLFEQNEVESVFLMIGINDLIWGETDADIIANYKEIVRKLRKQHPNTQIVVQSILPHGGEISTWESRDKLLALSSDRIVAMNKALQEIAKDNDAYYLDLYPIFATGDGHLRPDLTTDGLHLNREGYLVWRSAIALYAQLELQKEPDAKTVKK